MPYEDELKNSESLDSALCQLVKSIAKEEEALATLMQAEANKTLAFVGKDQNLPTHPSTLEFIQFNQTVTKILDSILMAEWMLMKKIDFVMHFQNSNQPVEVAKFLNKEAKIHKKSSFVEDEYQPYYNEYEDLDF